MSSDIDALQALPAEQHEDSAPCAPTCQVYTCGVFTGCALSNIGVAAAE